MNVGVRQWTSWGRWALFQGLFFGLLVLTALPQPAQSLEINIRAHSELQVGVSAAGTMVRVRGTLRERGGEGLAQRALTINFRDLNGTPNSAPLDTEPDMSAEVFTERGGVFRAHRELMPGRWGVEVAFKETPNLSGDRFSTTVQVKEMPVLLSLHVPSLIVGTDHALPVRVQATVEGVGLPEDAEVMLGAEPVGAVELDQFGRGTVQVQPPLRSGLHELRASLSNPRYAETPSAGETLRVSEQIELKAEIQEVLERLRRGLVVRGNVRDQLGALEGVRVSVELFRRGAAREPTPAEDDASEAQTRSPARLTVKTDSAGDFSAFFPSTDLADGVWGARVELVPDVGSRVSVEATPLKLDRKVSRWLLNLLAVLGLLGGVGLLLQRFWQVISAYWRERGRKRASNQRAMEAFEEVETLEVHTLETERPASVSEEASKTTLAGVVWDLWKQRPVARAKMQIYEAGGDESIRSLEIAPSAPGTPRRRAGTFRLGELPRGSYEMSLSAPGFMPSRLEFRLPHDGKLSHMRLGMVAIPLKIRRLYQSLVESLEGRDLWGTLSLQEIDDALQTVLRESATQDEAPLESSARGAFVGALKRHLRQGEADAFGEPAEDAQMSGEQLMAMMTAVVEETYFSGRVFDDAVWQLARRLAERIREKAQGGPS